MALAADSAQRYFRTPQSEFWSWNNIDIWYVRNRRIGRTDLLFASAISGLLHLLKIEKNKAVTLWVEFILCIHLWNIKWNIKVDEKYVIKNMYFLY